MNPFVQYWPAFSLALLLAAMAGMVVLRKGRLLRINNRHDAAESSCGAMAAALRRANEDLRAIIQNGPGVPYHADAGQMTVLAGERMFLGYSGQEWSETGRLRSRVDPTDLGQFDQIRSALQQDGKAAGEYRLLDRNDRPVWVHETAARLQREDGTDHVCGYLTDITAEKQRAQKLEQTQKLLSLGQLATGIGHELGQPLMAISLAAESGLIALEQGASGAAQVREKLDRILTMAERAGAIIGNMRTFGRKERLEMTPIRLSDSVAETLEMVRERLDREHIETLVDVPPTLPPSLVPPLLFQQVLINLIANACDAYHDAIRPQPEPHIIRIEARTEQGRLFLRVQDRAGGIPPDVMGRVFEPFFSTKGPTRGTGLGLSVCYGIVRQAGGMLSVRNQDGGASFEITLPIAGDTAAEPESAVP